VPTNPEKELREFLALPPFMPEGSSVPTHQNAETGTGGQPLKAVPPRPGVSERSIIPFTRVLDYGPIRGDEGLLKWTKILWTDFGPAFSSPRSGDFA
jgi:hypothetical protein